MNNDSLLKESAAVAGRMYTIANDIEANDADEKWRTASKLKNAANDAYFYVAQVAGAGEGNNIEFDCVSARKHLNTLKAMYIFATKQEMTELDPELVVSIDKLVSYVDAEQALSEKEAKHRADVDLEPWLEKYRIWQKISEK